MEYDFIIAGFGGQGVLLAGEVLATAFMDDGKYVTWYPSYGAEMRGGTVNCEVVMSGIEVSAVNKKEIDFLIALNQLSFDKFISKVKKGGMVIANSCLVREIRACVDNCLAGSSSLHLPPRADITYLFAPITKLAESVGNIKLANVLALGILAKASKLVSVESLVHALEIVLPVHRRNLLPLNIEALKIGYAYDLVPV
ncbi:MAG: 2-oxoacid:acceptor oxidoreductase family protein [Heliobacteriaceae bacterium]|jgi:2-oxoglutarate ferredoxin oxidoreductase subunit gamma|nr:2-oxoacid:acceptor oxidoreductase family protein [Heliobacteriaceae bacterium]